MSPSEARVVLENLANGIDPVTGELLGGDSPLHQAVVVRALFQAVKALSELERRAVSGRLKTAEKTAEKTGTAWSADEDQRLLAGFDGGQPVAELARLHQRSNGAIRSRLKRLGRLQDESAPA